LKYPKTCVFTSPVYVISCQTFSQAYQMVEVSMNIPSPTYLGVIYESASIAISITPHPL
jgi:hypothetical protein